FQFLFHAGRSHHKYQGRHRMSLHTLLIHMVDHLNIMETEMIDIILHGSPVVLVILHRQYRSLNGDNTSLNGDTLPADHADIILTAHLHLIQDHCPDLASHIMDGATAEILVIHADLIGIAC